jgi:branched-subunit amino acid ABC-type transport system permease component
MWPIISAFLTETSILFLVTVGFFLIHRSAKFLNIAHGDYVTLAVYLLWTFTSLLGWNIWVSIVLCMAAMGFISILIDRVSYKYLRGAPLALMLCTIGVGLIIRHSILMIWGGQLKTIHITLPNLEIRGMVISGSLLLALAFVGLIILLAYYLFKHTNLGITVRALADNLSLAENFGIDTEKTLTFLWFFSGCTATLAGVVLVVNQPLTYSLGFNWILLIFAVSILAGEKLSMPYLLVSSAVIAGGMEVGLFFIPEAYREGIGFAILIIALLVRRVLQK